MKILPFIYTAIAAAGAVRLLDCWELWDTNVRNIGGIAAYSGKVEGI